MPKFSHINAFNLGNDIYTEALISRSVAIEHEIKPHLNRMFNQASFLNMSICDYWNEMDHKHEMKLKSFEALDHHQSWNGSVACCHLSWKYVHFICVLYVKITGIKTLLILTTRSNENTCEWHALYVIHS